MNVHTATLSLAIHKPNSRTKTDLSDSALDDVRLELHADDEDDAYDKRDRTTGISGKGPSPLAPVQPQSDLL